jgi:hypothetical protein
LFPALCAAGAPNKSADRRLWVTVKNPASLAMKPAKEAFG